MSKLPPLVALAREADARTRVRAVLSADSGSPVNAGQMLLFPDPAVYEDGVQTIQTGFSVQRGWNRSGSLAEALAARPPRSVRGTYMRTSWPTTWNFVSAAVDQGFFAYMLLHAARADNPRPPLP